MTDNLTNDNILIDKIMKHLMDYGGDMNKLDGRYYNLISENRAIFDEIFQRLKSLSNSANPMAIQACYSMKYQMQYIYHDVEEPDFAEYLSKLSVNEIIEFLNRFPQARTYFFDRILSKKVGKLEEEIERLTNELKYVPGGNGYQEAKSEFDNIVQKQMEYQVTKSESDILVHKN